jgi:glucose/arabinose dehydrogenase
MIAFSGLVVSGCGDDPPAGVTPTPVPTPATPSTPGPAPSVSFQAAFTKLPAYDRPVALIEVPGQGRFLLVLQEGRVLSFAKDPNAAEFATVLDQRSRTSRDGDEEGLLGLALDPDFAKNGFIYAYYSAKGGTRRTVLTRFATNGQGASLRMDSASELTILEVLQPFPNHKGGQVAFGPDGMLYLGLGDGGSAGDPRGNGQDISGNLLGSIVRLDVRGASKDRPYAIPTDNPFAGRAGTRQETWAYGLRNPWRFSFDTKTGALWAGDVGQDTVEEVDIIKPGGNYGWNIMEGSRCFKGSSCNRSGLELPVAEYTHDQGGCSITGGFVYRGKSVPALAGRYLYGDYCTGAIWTLDADAAEAGKPVTPSTLRSRGSQLASFAQDPDGELYLIEFNGKIERIVP